MGEGRRMGLGGKNTSAMIKWQSRLDRMNSLMLRLRFLQIRLSEIYQYHVVKTTHMIFIGAPI